MHLSPQICLLYISFILQVFLCYLLVLCNNQSYGYKQPIYIYKIRQALNQAKKKFIRNKYFFTEMSALGNSHYIVFTFAKRMNFSIGTLSGVCLQMLKMRSRNTSPLSSAEHLLISTENRQQCANPKYWQFRPMYTNLRDLHSHSIQNRNKIFHHAGLFDKYAHPYVFKRNLHKNQRNQYLEMALLFCAGLQATLKPVIDPKPWSSCRISVPGPNC